MKKSDTILIIKDNLNMKEELLYSSFDNYLTNKFNLIYSIGIDIALAKSDIKQSPQKRKEELILVGNQPVTIDIDFIEDLFTEITDSLINQLDLMMENLEDDPYEYLSEYKKKLKSYFDDTLLIFFKRVLPQSITQRTKTPFLELFTKQDYEYAFTSDVWEKVYKSQMIVHDTLKEMGLFDVIKYYLTDYIEVYNTCSNRITEDDLDRYYDDPEEYEELFNSDIDVIKNELDKFFLKLIKLMKNGLPIVNKPFSTNVISVNNVNILIRNQIVTQESTDSFLIDAKLVFKKLKKKKLDEVLYGLNIIYDALSPISQYIQPRTMGVYFHKAERVKDKYRLKIERSVANSIVISAVNGDVDTIAHEIGHRYYYLLLPAESMNTFLRRIKTHTMSKTTRLFMVYTYCKRLLNMDLSPYLIGSSDDKVLINSVNFYKTFNFDVPTQQEGKTVSKSIGFSLIIGYLNIYKPIRLEQLLQNCESIITKIEENTKLTRIRTGHTLQQMFQNGQHTAPFVTVPTMPVTPYADSLAGKPQYKSEVFAELFMMYVLDDMTNDYQKSFMKGILNIK